MKEKSANVDGLEEGPSRRLKTSFLQVRLIFNPVKKHFKVSQSNTDGLLQAHVFFAEMGQIFKDLLSIICVYAFGL